MNLRPTFQLRLRDESQFMLWRQLALSAGLSMNEWILRRVQGDEAQAVSLREDRVREEGRGSACPSCGGMNGLHQKGCKKGNT